MAWRIVKQPNGLLARFSEVVDDFTHYDMTEDEAMEVCQEVMDYLDACYKVARGLDDEPLGGHRTFRGDGLNRFRYCIETIAAVHGKQIAKERVKMLSRKA